MSEKNDPRTPGRSAGASSTLAGQDLLRRLRRLPLPPEALPRVARFVEEEVRAALEAARTETFSPAEIQAAGGSEELVEGLRKRRSEAERLEALRGALSGLDRDELEQVLELAKRR